MIILDSFYCCSVALLRSQTPSIAPCGRFRSLAFLDGNLLYIYGGLVENRSVEGGIFYSLGFIFAILLLSMRGAVLRAVTLDDLWSVDLRTRSQWRCVVEGTMATRVRGEISFTFFVTAVVNAL
jgi:hypothetical protein